MRWLRRLSWAMTAVAAALLIWTGFGIVSTLHNQEVEAQQWDQRTFGSFIPAGSVLAFRHPQQALGSQVAKMEIPSQNYVAILLEGTNDNVLANGPGHYVGSAYPGEPDTLMVAGHNTFMLGLPNLKRGDLVIFTDPDGRFVYQIDSSRVIDPSDRGAMAMTGKPTLAISTCWPIWAGAFATQRLVIYGHLVAS